MKKNILRPSFLLAFLLLTGYITAEVIIRGNALNQISYGIGGLLLWGGIVLLICCWIILPVLRFATFPQWLDLDTLSGRDEIRYLEKMGKYYVNAFGRNCPDEIADLISELKKTLKNSKLSFSAYRNELKRIVREIHRQLTEVICDRVINDYMKKTAILVCISQRGWLDSVAMLVMQLRMIFDLSRNLGYRPSWIFMIYCCGWIIVNSIAFALFDGTEIVDDALSGLLPLILGESLSKSLPFVGKTFNIVMQGASAMAKVYAKGKIIQRKLTGTKERLSGKERVQLRIDGYLAAVKILANSSGVC